LLLENIEEYEFEEGRSTSSTQTGTTKIMKMMRTTSTTRTTKLERVIATRVKMMERCPMKNRRTRATRIVTRMGNSDEDGEQ
jgi:hypothetical protein